MIKDNRQTSGEIRTSENKNTKILVVDDAPVSLAILDKVLSSEYTVLKAEGGTEALDILSHGGISLILADVIMPEMSGLELLETIRAEDSYAAIPVMMITAVGNTANEIEALRLGAVDVVRKPFVPEILLARVRNLLVLSDSIRTAELNRKNQIRLKKQEEILRSIERDDLTGVLTRQAFYHHVRSYLDTHSTQKLEMILFDLDNFSIVNDMMGVKAGDRLLSDIGHEILNYQAFTTDIPIVGHLEADHFAALHDPKKQSAEDTFVYIKKWMSDYENKYHVNCRLGVYSIEDKSIEPAVMCDRALLAVRSTKGNFTVRFARYDDSIRKKLLEEQALTEEMLPALKEGQFVVYYQPQVNYSAGAVIGAEALVRWAHPKKGLLAPGIFLPLFERNGLITQLDNYVWECACRQLAIWYKTDGADTVPVSVNISRMDIYGEDLCLRLTNLVDKYQIPRKLLHLEITESAYVGDSKRLIEIVKKLSEAGFSIEMDDFGSAYSSLNMLKDIAVDVLKLDMKFLSDTMYSSRSGNILSSVVRMARWLKTPVIAEGVETKQQADYLLSIGCLYMQGYYFSKPIPLRKYEEYLKDSPFGKTDKYKEVNISDAEKFWDASTQTTLIFNSYVGGAIILERTGDALEMLRANDEFFKVIRITRDEYLPMMLDIWQRFDADTRSQFEQMLDQAAGGEKDTAYDLRSLPFHEGSSAEWTRNRAKLLAKNGTSEIFYVLVDNITAEKAAQDELAKQKKLLLKLYNNVPCGIINYSVEHEKLKLLDYNDTTWKMAGYQNRTDFEKAFSGSPYIEMIHPEERTLVLQKTKEVLNAPASAATECRIKRADGSYYWNEVRFQSDKDREGNETLQSICIDITDRRERETQKYGKVLFSIFDEIILLDYSTDQCRVLKGAEPYAHTGKTLSGIVSMHNSWISDFVTAEDRDKVRQFVQYESLRKNCEASSIPFIDYQINLPDGDEVFVRSSAFPVDANRFLFCCRDVTREKEAAAQLRKIAVLKTIVEDRERYRIIVEQAGATVVEWNCQTGEFFHTDGYKNYAFSNRDQSEIFQNKGNPADVFKDDVHILRKFFEDSSSGHASAEAVLRLKMSDGTYRWTKMRSSFKRDESGKLLRMIGSFTDVDGEMRAKEQLRDNSAKLTNVIANIPVGVGIYRLDSLDKAIPLYVSDRTCAIFGFTREEYDQRITNEIPINFMPDKGILTDGQLDAVRKGKAICLPRLRAFHKDGSIFWLWLYCAFTIQKDEPILCYAMMFDISHDASDYRLMGRLDNLEGILRKQEKELEKAHTDQVTDLHTKDMGRETVTKLLKNRPEEQMDAMLFLDIDNFKSINDSVGHLDADHILTKVGKVLKESFRSTDLVARFGGDEFLIYMVAPENRAAVRYRTEQLLWALRTIPAGNGDYLQCSIGVAEVTGTLRDFDTVYNRADQAMYQAKQDGKNSYAIYQP